MSRASVARLFVAADIPDAERATLAAWGREAARAASAPVGPPPPREPGARDADRATPALRAIAEESIHLTLCFLGSRPIVEIESAAAVLPGCAAHACELRVGAPVWLPPRRPRALAVALHDETGGELERLQAQLRDALAEATGWQPERRRFHPHITLVRVRGAGRGRRRERRAPPGAGPGGQAITGASLPPTPALVFAPESVTLYRSRLDPAGARYEALTSCRLLPPEDG
jgi:2'-5' RNA ligase